MSDNVSDESDNFARDQILESVEKIMERFENAASAITDNNVIKQPETLVDIINQFERNQVESLKIVKRYSNQGIFDNSLRNLSAISPLRRIETDFLDLSSIRLSTTQIEDPFNHFVDDESPEKKVSHSKNSTASQIVSEDTLTFETYSKIYQGLKYFLAHLALLLLSAMLVSCFAILANIGSKRAEGTFPDDFPIIRITMHTKFENKVQFLRKLFFLRFQNMSQIVLSDIPPHAVFDIKNNNFDEFDGPLASGRKSENQGTDKSWLGAFDNYITGNRFAPLKNIKLHRTKRHSNFFISEVFSSPKLSAVELNNSLVNFLRTNKWSTVDWTSGKASSWMELYPRETESLMLLSLLLPVSSVIELSDIIDKQHVFAPIFKALLEKPKFLDNGETYVLNSGNVFLYTRSKKRSLTYLVAYNAGYVTEIIDLDLLVPFHSVKSINIVSQTSNYCEMSQIKLKQKMQADFRELPILSKSAVVISYL